jgi:hypothetical protein
MMKRILLLILAATLAGLLGGCVFYDRDHDHRDHDRDYDHHDSDHHGDDHR